jgi:hypothetical protein
MSQLKSRALNSKVSRKWLGQFLELESGENVKVGETDSGGFQRSEDSGEKMYCIWVKDTNIELGEAAGQ